MSLEKLKKKLDKKKHRVRVRYKYYDEKERVRDLGISTPPDLRYWMGTLGWCGKAVDSIADRLVFDGFSNDIYGFNKLFAANNGEILTDEAFHAALIGSCSFAYLTTVDGEVKMRIIDGAHATGDIDPTTYLLKEGYAIIDYDDHDRPITEAYCTAGHTYIYENGKYAGDVPNNVPYPLLVPIIYKPDAVRPFGRSRISRACMSLVCSAIRTCKRSEIAGEFYSFPQKFAIGLSNEAQDNIDKWAAAMSAMFTITADEDGNKPTVGQFQAGSMQPHTEQLKMFASLFAGQTGLTLEDLGFSGANPSSSEAIKATHEDLKLKARAAQRDFAVGLKNIGYIASMLQSGEIYSRAALADVNVKWEPLFDPDFEGLASVGDALFKIAQVKPDFLADDMIEQLTGLKRNAASTELWTPEQIDKELENE